MTCAEARRQLPGPEGPTGEIAAHLDACDPCRSEADALREVDRRLGRLGDYRLLSTAEQVLQLDRQMEPEVTAAPALRSGRYLWLGLVSLLMLLVGALGYRLLHR